MTPLRLTSTGRVGNTAQIVITPERAASRPSGASSRPFGLPRAWASKATIANGSICCELAIEDPYGRSGRTALLWRNRASRVRQIHGADRATSPASRLRRPSPCLRSASDPSWLAPTPQSSSAFSSLSRRCSSRASWSEFFASCSSFTSRVYLVLADSPSEWQSEVFDTTSVGLNLRVARTFALFLPCLPIRTPLEANPAQRTGLLVIKAC